MQYDQIKSHSRECKTYKCILVLHCTETQCILVKQSIWWTATGKSSYWGLHLFISRSITWLCTYGATPLIMFHSKEGKTSYVIEVIFFFFFSFAYTTSPAAVMKLVVFFRSSKPPDNFWWSGVAEGHCAIRSGWCLLHIWRTCSVVWSSSPQGHVGGKERFLVSCACVRWACCGRSAVVPKPPGRACQEGGMHPSPVWVSALFWWWWSFPGNVCWLTVALLALQTAIITLKWWQYINIWVKYQKHNIPAVSTMKGKCHTQA